MTRPAWQQSLTLMDLAPWHVPSAATLCARAMRDNPVHVRCFGADAARRERRLRCFFTGLLRYGLRHGLLLGAFAEEEPVGVVGALASGACWPSWWDGLRLMPYMARCHTPVGLWRTSHWLLTWLRAEPNEPHWHMGPLAVAPHWQGRGVALQLARVMCRRAIARQPAALYLETDTRRNVRLYRTFGFAVVGTRRVGDVVTWQMLRPATHHWSRRRGGEPFDLLDGASMPVRFARGI